MRAASWGCAIAGASTEASAIIMEELVVSLTAALFFIGRGCRHHYWRCSSTRLEDEDCDDDCDDDCSPGPRQDDSTATTTTPTLGTRHRPPAAPAELSTAFQSPQFFDIDSDSTATQSAWTPRDNYICKYMRHCRCPPAHWQAQVHQTTCHTSALKHTSGACVGFYVAL